MRGAAADTVSFGGLPSCSDYIISTKQERVVGVDFLHANHARGGEGDANLVVATQHSLFNIEA